MPSEVAFLEDKGRSMFLTFFCVSSSGDKPLIGYDRQIFGASDICSLNAGSGANVLSSTEKDRGWISRTRRLSEALFINEITWVPKWTISVRPVYTGPDKFLNGRFFTCATRLRGAGANSVKDGNTVYRSKTCTVPRVGCITKCRYRSVQVFFA